MLTGEHLGSSLALAPVICLVRGPAPLVWKLAAATAAAARMLVQQRHLWQGGRSWCSTLPALLATTAKVVLGPACPALPLLRSTPPNLQAEARRLLPVQAASCCWTRLTLLMF